jgi:hypothetical protein
MAVYALTNCGVGRVQDAVLLLSKFGEAPAADRECAAVDSDFLEMLQDTVKNKSRYSLVLLSQAVQECLVTHTICAFQDVDRQLT